MDITCTACIEGTASDGNPCTVCGGDGVINLTDDNFSQCIHTRKLHGIIWDDILTRLSDIEDKVNDVVTKCDDIKEVVDEL